jgi:hypothetical protein
MLQAFGGQPVERTADFAHDLRQRGIGRERVTRQRRRPAMGQNTFGVAGKIFTRVPLPVTAMDEDEARRVWRLGRVEIPALGVRHDAGIERPPRQPVGEMAAVPDIDLEAHLDGGLGADMHGYNTVVPPPPGTPGDNPDDENHPFAGQARFSLTQAMSSMLALGLTLQQVVPMVTRNAAQMAGVPDEVGALKPGMAADVSVLNDIRGRFKLQDNERTQIVAERLLEPAFCLRAGRRYEATAPILPRAVAA